MRLVIPIVMMLCLPALADPPKPERIEVTAKVAEIPQPIRYCGGMAFRTVVRFEVVSVDKGAWADKDVYAIKVCPETLKVGQKLRLTLEKTTSTEGYVDRFPKTSARWLIRELKGI